MLKHKEQTDPTSCLSRARQDEMIFVLLARDAAAPAAIRFWAAERLRLGKNAAGDEQIVEALACAAAMAGLTANEATAAALRASGRFADGKPDGSREELDQCARMLDTYAPELYPANELGQIDFARAMMESTAEVIRTYVARVYGAKPEGGAA